jgi:hypothetical protein
MARWGAIRASASLALAAGDPGVGSGAAPATAAARRKEDPWGVREAAKTLIGMDGDADWGEAAGLVLETETGAPLAGPGEIGGGPRAERSGEREMARAWAASPACRCGLRGEGGTKPKEFVTGEVSCSGRRCGCAGNREIPPLSRRLLMTSWVREEDLDTARCMRWALWARLVRCSSVRWASLSTSRGE